MIVYTVVGQGQYVDLKDDLALQKKSPWSMYVNLTNRCTCSCTFCLRSMKKMAEDETLWLKQEPTVDEVKKNSTGLLGTVSTKSSSVVSENRRNDWKT